MVVAADEDKLVRLPDQLVAVRVHDDVGSPAEGDRGELEATGQVQVPERLAHEAAGRPEPDDPEPAAQCRGSR
jgi:hypothetical protein